MGGLRYILRVMLHRFILCFTHPIDVFYDCYEKQRYLTIKITKYPFGGRLIIGNAIYPEINQICNKSGILVSQNHVYGYVTFDYGYMLFGGNLQDTHFGYSLWKSKREKDAQEVTTFCTYVPFSENSLIEKITLLIEGEKIKQ